jgi:hypothetical protein
MTKVPGKRELHRELAKMGIDPMSTFTAKYGEFTRPFLELRPPRVDRNERKLDTSYIAWNRAQLSILAPVPASIEINIGHYLKSQSHGGSKNWGPGYGVSSTLRKTTMHACARLDLEDVIRWLIGVPNTLRFTRLAPRELESHDNLRTAFKPILDQVTCWLAGNNTHNARANDGKRSGYDFQYAQLKQKAYGYRIEVSRV